MPWTAPRTWVTGQLVTADELNTDLRDNLNHLYDRRNIATNAENGIFTTSSLNFGQIGTLSVSLNTVGTVVLLLAEIRALSNSDPTHYTLLQWYNVTTASLFGQVYHMYAPTRMPVVLTAYEVVSPGSYTWRLDWRVSDAATTGSIDHIRLRAIEIV